MRYCRSTGVSFVEVLLTLTMVSLLMLPLMLSVSAGSRDTITKDLISTRSGIANSLIDEIDSEDPLFTTDYDMGNTPNTVRFTEAGQSIAYLRRVETSSAYSSALKRRTYLNLYANASDPVSAPLVQSTEDINLNSQFIDVGLTSGSYTDNTGQVWVADLAYDSAANSGKHVPGYISANAGTVPAAGSAITNGSDSTIYKTYRLAANTTTPLEYTIDVENGNYLVQLYFAEEDATVTNAAPHRRSMDIYVGDQAFGSAAQVLTFSPYVYAGNAVNRASMLQFDTKIATGKINIWLKGAAAGTDLAPILNGISISRE